MTSYPQTGAKHRRRQDRYVPRSFDDRLNAACAWAASLEGYDADWEAFTAWLGANPANVEAYDAVAAIEADIGRLAPSIRTILPANEEPRGGWLRPPGELH